MFDSVTLDLVRSITPGVRNVAHFNNAGSSLPPQPVIDATIGHIQREADIGGYEAAAEAHEELEGFYDNAATLLNAHRDQIGFIENATRAWDMAVYGYPFAQGDRVLTCRAEYASNLIALMQLHQQCGIEIVVIDDDEHGQIDLSHLERELRAGAEMVAMTHIPTNGGLVNPAEAVGDLCQAYDTFYVLDACQSVGQIPLDVQTLKCDVLSGTGRKYLRGPRGTGFVYAGPRALERIEPPMLDLHAAVWTSETTYTFRDDARRFENWETNFAGKIGLSAAMQYALDVGIDASSARLFSLAANMRTRLNAIDGTTVHDQGSRQAGIVTFTIDGHTAEQVKAELASQNINISVSAMTHDHFGIPRRDLPKMLRASVHYFNNDSEIDRLLAAASDLASGS